MIHPYVFIGLKDFVMDTDKMFAKQIIEIVAKHYGMTKESILERTRKQSVVIPRQIAMWIVRNKTNIGLVKIGEIFGGYDHTSVMHSIRSIDNDIHTKQEKTTNQIELINDKIQQIVFKRSKNEQDRANISSN